MRCRRKKGKEFCKQKLRKTYSLAPEITCMRARGNRRLPALGVMKLPAMKANRSRNREMMKMVPIPVTAARVIRAMMMKVMTTTMRRKVKMMMMTMVQRQKKNKKVQTMRLPAAQDWLKMRTLQGVARTFPVQAPEVRNKMITWTNRGRQEVALRRWHPHQHQEMRLAELQYRAVRTTWRKLPQENQKLLQFLEKVRTKTMIAEVLKS